MSSRLACMEAGGSGRNCVNGGSLPGATAMRKVQETEVTEKPLDTHKPVEAEPDPVQYYRCPSCYADYKPKDKPEDGRCHECEDSPNLRAKTSEFGAGVVVCLVKFTEHLFTDRDRVVWELGWVKRGKREESDLGAEAKRHLDFERSWRKEHPEFVKRPGDPLEAAISSQIELWANAASDHFYDLDREHAPQALVELADLMLEMGHGFRSKPPDEQPWTLEDMERVHELWKESTKELDRRLGVVPSWGEY